MTHHKLKLSWKICTGCGPSFIWRTRWTRYWARVDSVPSVAARLAPPQAGHHPYLTR
ncbi:MULTISPECIES: DUF2256 domain-containing protein [Sphingobium]|uniref:DUF2256 domain-containing protein n=1 Tax=Sphingobium TaxID=165695 RepID=UPI0035C74DF4